jgi:chromosome segregation ATPase
MTSDEMQGAIEFLLKNQANFEVQLEKTNLQLERTDQQLERTNQQLQLTDQRVSLLAETQTEFIQTMLGHVEAQVDINGDMRRTMKELAQAQRSTTQELSELAQAQRQTQREISDLTKIIASLVETVYRDDNPPQRGS